MPTQTILVTGGAGYVGSHTTLELLIAGHNVVVVDNLCNSFCEKGAAMPEGLRRVQIITGKNIVFYPIDIRDGPALKEVFEKVSENWDCPGVVTKVGRRAVRCPRPVLYAFSTPTNPNSGCVTLDMHTTWGNSLMQLTCVDAH